MLRFYFIYLSFSLVTAWPQGGYDQSQHLSDRRFGNESPQLRYRRQQQTEHQVERKLRPIRKLQKQPQAKSRRDDINNLSGNRMLRPVEQTRRNEKPNRKRPQQIRRNEVINKPNNQHFRRNEEINRSNKQQFRKNTEVSDSNNQQIRSNDEISSSKIQKFRRNEEFKRPNNQQFRRNEQINRSDNQQFRRKQEISKLNNEQIRRKEVKTVNQNINRSWDIERSDNEQADDRSSYYETDDRSPSFEDQETSPSNIAEERSSSYESIPPPPEQAKIEAAVAAGAAGYNAESYTDPQRLQFQIHGQGGPNSYRFGYDTGVGYNRQFRYEERDEYGVLHGRYGYYDQEGKLQIVNYTADPEKGFQAEGDHVPKPQY